MLVIAAAFSAYPLLQVQMMLPCSRSPAWVMPIVVAWYAMGSTWFVSSLFPLELLKSIEAVTSGWLTVTLLASMAIGGIGVGIVLTAGRLELRDLGLRKEALPLALFATAVLWTVMQLSTALTSGTAGPEIAPTWSSGPGRALGPLLAQLLGTALMEEVIFRGYLWPRLTGYLKATWGLRRASVAGLLLSQLAFALLHIPMLVYRGLEGAAMAGTLLMLAVAGLYFALLYALTRNLFFAIGAHALANATTPLFVPQGPAPTLVLAATAIALAAAWRLRPWDTARNGVLG